MCGVRSSVVGRCAGRDRPFRGVEIAPLSSVVDDLAELRQPTFTAYRTALGVDGAELPGDFGEVVDAVTTFADPLADPSSDLR